MANIVLTYEAAGLPTSVTASMEQPDALVAPAQIWLRAETYEGMAEFLGTGSQYDGAHMEYEHEWTINGEPIPAFTHVTNLLPEHNNPNKRFGRKVPFVLEEPGTYSFSLVVTDRLGNAAVLFTDDIVVQDPNVYFPEADRIYVDPLDDFDADGVPATATRVTSLEELRTTGLPAHTTNPTWLLFRRGREFSLGGVDPANNDNYKGVLNITETSEVRMLSPYGSGADPVFTQDPRADRNFTKCMIALTKPKTSNWRTVHDLAFRGYYDPETEHGWNTYMGGVLMEGWNLDGGFSLMHNLTVTGLSTAVRPGGALNGWGHHQVLSNIVVTSGWLDFATLGGQPGQHLAYIGCNFLQKQLVPNYGAKDDIRTTHGAIRISSSHYVYIAMCSLFSRSDWQDHDQACIRLFTRPDTVQWAVIDRCTMEGGYEVIHLRNTENTIMYPANILISRVFAVGSTFSSAILNAERSGFLVRNCVLIRPNVPMLAPSGNAGMIAMGRTNNPEEDETEESYAYPVGAIGSTFINLLSDANDGTAGWPTISAEGGLNGTYFTQVIDQDNVHHRPNAASPIVDYAPLDMTKHEDFSRRYLGRRYNFVYPTQVLGSDVPDGGTVRVPYSSITTGLFKGASGSPTDQAYWLAVPDENHQVNLSGTYGPRRYYAKLGDTGLPAHIAVSFSDPDDVIITNNTGETWPAGVTFSLWLDRASLQPAIDSTYETPIDVPMPFPLEGSPAIGAAGGSWSIPTKDLLLADRGASPSKGALEPAP